MQPDAHIALRPLQLFHRRFFPLILLRPTLQATRGLPENPGPILVYPGT